MKTKLRSVAPRSGSAFITTMFVIGVLSVVTAGMITIAVNQPFAVRRDCDMIRAKAIAEAGANIAFVMICSNYSTVSNSAAFPVTNYRGGKYDPTVTPMSPTSAVISCIGVYNVATSTVALDVRNITTNMPTGSGQPAATGAYACAMMSGGQMTWNGNSTVNMGAGTLQSNTGLQIAGNSRIQGDVAIRGQLKMTGNARVTGDATAASYSLSGNTSVTGTKTTGTVPLVAIPDIDLTPYYNTALANGQVYSSSHSFSGNYTMTPPGGIIWVDGDLSFSGNGTITGCIIATGNITMSGNVTQNAVNYYPALVSQTGNITLAGNTSLHGLLYTKTGNTTISGNVELTGSIISAGTYNMSGNFTAYIYQNSTPVAPGGSSSSPVSNVGITAWRQ